MNEFGNRTFTTNVVDNSYSINDLPDEVLEYILSLLPPYKELEHCKLVCRRWKKNVANVIHHIKQKLIRSLENFNVKWECVVPPGKCQTITKRYSHSACYHENLMYVFGGCTCTSTTFNDLWKLDLSTRQWSRLLTMGTYPAPKACATLLYHDNSLVLFGGWTHPSPYPLHQTWKTFSELHIYDIELNRWSCVMTEVTPPPMAGHSATIHKDKMVVFGGLHGQSGSSNDIWCFNLSTRTWSRTFINGCKPLPRYGQSQIALDEDHFIILGGCGSGNMNLNDVWLMDMTETEWKWRQVTVRNPRWAASHLWCHPACKIGQFVVVFSRNPISVSPIVSKWRPQVRASSQSDNFDRDPTIPLAVRRASEVMVEPAVVDRDVNVNGRRGCLALEITRHRLQQDFVQPLEMNEPSGALENIAPMNSALISLSVQKPSAVIAVSSMSALRNLFTSGNLQNIQLIQSEDPSPACSRSNEELQSSESPNNSAKTIGISANCTSNNNSTISINPSNSRLRGVNADERSASAADRYQKVGLRRFENGTPTTSWSRRMSAFSDATPRRQNLTRERRLELLKRLEEYVLRRTTTGTPPGSVNSPPPSPPPSLPVKRAAQPQVLPNTTKSQPPKMAMFVLDVSTVLTDECYATWLPIKSVAEGSPDDMILYSLVVGNGELIMFGGIQKDAMSINQHAQASVNISNIVSNSLYFISPPRSVI